MVAIEQAGEDVCEFPVGRLHQDPEGLGRVLPVGRRGIDQQVDGDTDACGLAAQEHRFEEQTEAFFGLVFAEGVVGFAGFLCGEQLDQAGGWILEGGRSGSNQLEQPVGQGAEGFVQGGFAGALEILQEGLVGSLQIAQSLGQEEAWQPFVGSLPEGTWGRIRIEFGRIEGVFEACAAFQGPESVFGGKIDWIEFHGKTAGLD